jgi:hypothetical protein
VATSTPTPTATLEAEPTDLDDVLQPPILDTPPVNTILDDIANTVVNYLATYVDIEFVDLEFTTGTVLNVNEEAHFRLHVINKGPLTMKDVKIRIIAKSGAKVKGAGAADVFDGEAFANTIDTVGGHNSANPSETERLHLKAPPGTKPAGTDLVEAYIDEWDADWAHTLLSHSRAGEAPNGLYEAQVHVR